MRKFLLASFIILFSLSAGAQSLEGINPATMYKDLIHLYNANQGVSATTSPVYDGAGNALPFKLSLAEMTFDTLNLGYSTFTLELSRQLGIDGVYLYVSQAGGSDANMMIDGVYMGSSFKSVSQGTTLSWSTGVPEGVVTANRGSVYGDVTNGEMYIKNIGSTNTGWERVARVSELLGGSISNPLLRLDTTLTASLQDVKDGVGVTSPLSLSTQAVGVNSSLAVSGNFTSTDTTERLITVVPTVTQTGTAGYTGFHLNVLEFSTGSGEQLLLDLQKDGFSKFSVDSTGETEIIGQLKAFDAVTVFGEGVTAEDFSAISTDSSSAGSPNEFYGRTTYNQSGTAGSNNLEIERVENTLGTGEHNFVNLITDGVSQTKISNTGDITTKGAMTSSAQTNLTADGDAFVKLEALGYLTASAGEQSLASFTGTVEQGGTAGYNGIYVDVTESTLGSGKHNLLSLNTGGSTVFKVSNAGYTTVYDSLYAIGYISTNAYYESYPPKTAASGVDFTFFSNPAYNQTLTAGSSDFWVNRIETALGSGEHNFMDLQVSGVTKARIDNTGKGFFEDMEIADQLDVLGYTTVLGISATAASDLKYLDTEFFYQDHHNIENGGSLVRGFQIDNTYDQGGIVGSVDLRIDRTENTLGTVEEHNFIDMRVGGATKARIDNAGDGYFNDLHATDDWVSVGETDTGLNYIPALNKELGIHLDGVAMIRLLDAISPLNIPSVSLDPTGTGSPMLQIAHSNTVGHSSALIKGASLDILDTNLTENAVTYPRLNIETTYNQSGTEGSTDIYVDRTETLLGSGKHKLIDLNTDGSSMFDVDNNGNTTVQGNIDVTGYMYTEDYLYALGYIGTDVAFEAYPTKSSSSGTDYTIYADTGYAQSDTAGSTDILINRVESILGSGEHNFIDMQVSGTTKARIDNTGSAFFEGDVTVQGDINVVGGILGDRACRTYGFTSQGIGAGTYYIGSWYNAPAAHTALTQASLTQAHGVANKGYGAHAFIVAAGAGSTDAGTVSIVVSGTSVTDAGVRTTTDSETVIADITTMATNDYYETAKKWIGQVTYTLTPAGATTYDATFNYGFSKYEDCGNTDFILEEIQVTGLGGAADSSFNFELLHHSAIHGAGNWVYSAAAFEPGLDENIADWVTDYGTESELGLGEYFAWKRSILAHTIVGSGSEGMVMRITTGASNSVQSLDVTLCVIKE